MNDSQENKLSAYYAVVKLVDSFNTVWTTNVPFSTVYNLFKTKVPLIEQKRNAQILENTGAAKEKAQKKAELVDKAFFIANRTQSYALAVNNTDLFATVNFTVSDLQKTRDTDLSGVASNILAKANANAAALVPYGVTAALLTDLTTVIAAYITLLAKPRVAKVTTGAATKALGILITDTDNILDERLDREIVFYKTSNVDFYNQYFQSRKIIQTSKSKLAMKGIVTDVDTSDFIQGVKVKITNAFEGALLAANAKALKLSKKTTQKGNFQVTNLVDGVYQVELSKPGYATQVVKINISEGDTAKMEVALVKA